MSSLIFSPFCKKSPFITTKKGNKRDNINSYMSRPLCICGFRPAAINYIKEGKTHYRRKCEVCLSGGIAKGIPKWYQDGYRIKSKCDKCGFSSKHIEQFNVFHVDGDMNNTRIVNLKTVCANCQRVLAKEGITWRAGGIQPDL
jgi:hypothetical protein